MTGFLAHEDQGLTSLPREVQRLGHGLTVFGHAPPRVVQPISLIHQDNGIGRQVLEGGSNANPVRQAFPRVFWRAYHVAGELVLEQSETSLASSKVEVPESVRETVRRWNPIDKLKIDEVLELLSNCDWRRAHQVDMALRHAEEDFEGKVELEEGLAWCVTHSGVRVSFIKGDDCRDIFVVVISYE